MLQGFLVAFGTVFLAELPDKTMVASLVLTTRFHRPLAVWVGVSAAFALHVALAVTIGSLLRRLPENPMPLDGLLAMDDASLLNPVLQVLWSEPLDPDSLTDSTVWLEKDYNGTRVPVTISAPPRRWIRWIRSW